jgi:3-hydroxy acid dehydrogenase / malonic semialdehyde reductase
LALGVNPISEGDVDDWEQMINVNCKGLLYVSKAVLPGMLERKNGYIVNIGSVAGNYALPGGNVYCGTKAFVNHLSLAMRAE